jgi:hypothetical protein
MKNNIDQLMTNLQYKMIDFFFINYYFSFIIELILNRNAFVLNGPNHKMWSALSDCRSHEGPHH